MCIIKVRIEKSKKKRNKTTRKNEFPAGFLGNRIKSTKITPLKGFFIIKSVRLIIFNFNKTKTKVF